MLIIDLYKLLFVGSYMYILKTDNGGEFNLSAWHACSALLLIIVSHFLFIISLLMLFYDGYKQLSSSFFVGLMGGLTLLFGVGYIGGGRYKKLLEEKFSDGRCVLYAMGINVFMIASYFFVAIFLIGKM